MNSSASETEVAAFCAAARRHFEATLVGDYRTANKEAKKIHGAFLKIVALGTDGREALLQASLEQPGPEACMAATYSLKYAPERSLAVLKRVSKEPGILGFKAAQAMKRWNSGEWQLE